jgi:hypothetical protein
MANYRNFDDSKLDGYVGKVESYPVFQVEMTDKLAARIEGRSGFYGKVNGEESVIVLKTN